jgi:hypothetical protein
LLASTTSLVFLRFRFTATDAAVVVAVRTHGYYSGR